MKRLLESAVNLGISKSILIPEHESIVGFKYSRSTFFSLLDATFGKAEFVWAMFMGVVLRDIGWGFFALLNCCDFDLMTNQLMGKSIVIYLPGRFKSKRII